MNPENAVKIYFDKTFTHKPDKVLLALSGGADSMVLAHILLKLQIPFAAAHCNYQLRGNESNEDEQTVASFCKENNILLHSKKFNTLDYCKQNKVGIQEGARNIRYDYFKDLCTRYKYNFICTAHQKNDFAETYLFNLFRGAGIKGLRGILPKRDNLIRPMLDAEKKEIYTYAQKHQVPYREDQSNYKNDYSRNYIRNEIIPELLLLQPNLISDIYESGQDMQKLQQYKMDQLASFEQQFIVREENHFQININDWLSRAGGVNFFKIYLLELGFNKDAIKNILHAKSGSKFFSTDYLLELYKSKGIVTRREQLPEIPEQLIDKNTASVIIGTKEYTIKRIPAGITTFTPGRLYFDADLLTYPLLLRKWEPGDKFIPFGMTGFKKVSDFLTDLKVPAYIKNNTCVLISEDKIAAVIPYRTDNRFLLTDQTSIVLCIYPK